MLKKISSILFDMLIVFAIFGTYIEYKDEISLFEYSTSMIIITIIVMFVHEIGHLFTIKLFCYKVLYFRFLGMQISFYPVFRVDFSTKWLLQSAVLGDYFGSVRKNDDLDEFFRNFYIISLNGPITNLFLLGIGVVLMIIGERYDLFCLQLLITNLNILSSCFKEEKNVFNDLYVVTNYELCKRDIVLTILSQDYSTTEYMKKIRKGYMLDVVSQDKLNSMYINCVINYFWDIYLDEEIKSDEIFEVVEGKADKYIYDNVYLFYELLSVVVILKKKCNKDYKDIYNRIISEQFILYVLKQNSSGAKFFVERMDVDYDISNKTMYKDYKKAMYSIGKYYTSRSRVV